MKIKQSGYAKTTLNQFQILGTGETALSKGLAFLLASNRHFYYDFLKLCGVRSSGTEGRFKEVAIEIEKKCKSGRTDIEICHQGFYHIIIECKVGKNKLGQQLSQYMSCIKDEPECVMVFLTQEFDSNRIEQNGVDVRFIGWRDVLQLMEKKYHQDDATISDFANFVNQEFRMSNRKDILVQDLANKNEIKLFEEHCLYRRDPVYGSPLYFAPNYTRHSGKTEGITKLASIRGVITFRAGEFGSLNDIVKGFADGDEKKPAWIKDRLEP